MGSFFGICVLIVMAMPCINAVPIHRHFVHHAPQMEEDPVATWTKNIPSAKGPETVTVHLNRSTVDESTSSVLLFSTMDPAYQTAYRNYTAVNHKYASVHGYGYMYDNDAMGLTGMSREMPTAYYSRIYGAINLLTAKTAYQGPKVDWIVYLDGDAVINERNLPMQLSVNIANAFAQAHGSARTCDFISQDFGHIVNSGYWMIRNSTWSVEFLKRWVAESAKEHRDGFHWVDDQGPLQNTILHYAAEHPLKNPKPYEDRCRHPVTARRAHEANICWKTSMAEYGYPYEHRVVNGGTGTICLIPPTEGIPYRTNMHYDYMDGDFVRHQKGLKPEQLEGYQPFVKYHPESNTVTYTAFNKS